LERRRTHRIPRGKWKRTRENRGGEKRERASAVGELRGHGWEESAEEVCQYYTVLAAGPLGSGLKNADDVEWKPRTLRLSHGTLDSAG